MDASQTKLNDAKPAKGNRQVSYSYIVRVGPMQDCVCFGYETMSEATVAAKWFDELCDAGTEIVMFQKRTVRNGGGEFLANDYTRMDPKVSRRLALTE